jgi:hypothetical protein
MPNRDDDDLQSSVMDFVDYAVIAHAKSPCVPAFQLFDVDWSRIGFKSDQA